MNASEKLVAEYERIARQNRPDWDAFIDDATDDPAGIAWEFAELAADLNLGIDTDTAFGIASDWLDAL